MAGFTHEIEPAQPDPLIRDPTYKNWKIPIFRSSFSLLRFLLPLLSLLSTPLYSPRWWRNEQRSPRGCRHDSASASGIAHKMPVDPSVRIGCCLRWCVCDLKPSVPSYVKNKHIGGWQAFGAKIRQKERWFVHCRCIFWVDDERNVYFTDRR